MQFFSGGLGGLGLLTARLLVNAGAKQIVVSSRSDRVVAGSEADWEWLAKCRADVQRVRCDSRPTACQSKGAASVEDERLTMLLRAHALTFLSFPWPCSCLIRIWTTRRP